MRARDVPAQVRQGHLHNLLFRDAALEKQGNRFGYGPAILAQQAFPKQTEMFLAPSILRIAGLNPDFILTNLDGECLQIVAFVIEAASAFEIEAAAVPVAGENAVANCSTRQRIAHVRTLVVGGVDPSIDVE